MISRDNVLTVSRGETFTIDKVVRNADGSAYVIPTCDNPHFVITIASQAYSKANTFKKNFYLRYDQEMFHISRPQLLSIDGVVQSSFTTENAEQVYVEGYHAGGANSCVFYVNNDPTICKYVKVVSGVPQWVSYECSIATSFANYETETWTEGNYVWSINFVAGNATYPDGANAPVFSYISHAIPIMKATSLKVVSPLVNLKEVTPHGN